MANTTSANLKLTVQQTGENAGTWGQVTNTNLLILEQAIGGYDAVNVASSPTALVFSNGALSNGKNQVIKLTGTITGNVDVTIPDSIEKTYIVENATIGVFTVTFKTSSGTGITWSTTDKGKKILYSDGTNVLEGISSMGDLVAGDVTTNTISTNTINVSNITISASTTANTISASGDVTTSGGNMTDQIGEIRSVPINSKTAPYTLLLTDHGKFISTDSAITVPPSVFTAGQTVTIYNDSASGFAITKGAGVTMYWVQTGADEDRTLSTRGVATILCVATDVFVITGGTLS
jgi:hypothetical protein